MSRPATMRKAPRGEYIETDSGNKISRMAHIAGTANITLGGKTVIMAGVHLRGDLHRFKSDSATSKDDGGRSASKSTHAISIGRHSVVGRNCVIKPPSRVSGDGQVNYYPMKIGDHVYIGDGSHVHAASIASHVHIGNGSVLGPFCVVRDNVKILPCTVVAPNTVIPSNSIYGGAPGGFVGQLGEGWGVQPAGHGLDDMSVEGGDLRALVKSIR